MIYKTHSIHGLLIMLLLPYINNKGEWWYVHAEV
ncbi:MAG: hypothetical protein JWM44_2890 [Bacilli bacterium]|nr:hypothetical protein [Bacilli bacterium]